jgi:hypothetical protein
MARAVRFLEDFGRVKAKNKKLVGGFKKDEIWEGCSKQLAQKLVNRRGVAEYVVKEISDPAKK